MTLPRRGRVSGSWTLVLVLAAMSAVVLTVMNPWWIVTANTPTGGDMGAHVFGPAYLRDTLLPSGRILGWSQDWFAGFPAFYFYFPLPSLVIVLFDLVLPYGVAFKLVTVMGLLATPPAAYYLARALRFGRHVSLVAASSGVIFAFMESYSIYGGNIASSLAGEFSYSWSFALSLLYLGLLIKTVLEDRKYLKWAAVVLAATALSHVLTTIVVVFASLFVLAWKRGVVRTVAIWLWGFAIAGFWALPLVARIGITSDMAWHPLAGWDEIFPIEMWLLLPIAIPAAVAVVRRTPRATPVLAATLLPVIYYPLPVALPELLPAVFGGGRWKLWNGRLLPYWYFGVGFFAALGVGLAVLWLVRRLPSRLSMLWPRLVMAAFAAAATILVGRSPGVPENAWVPVAAAGVALLWLSTAWPATVGTRNFLTTTAAAVLVLGAAAGVSFVDGWSKWNYEGYEAKAAWPEYQALMLALDDLPDGRVHWEANNELNKYGTPMSPMLIPYWTEGSHKSMEGLYFESSITTPFHFINSSEMSHRPSNPIPGLKYHTGNLERGIRHLQLFGVSYYVSFTPEATAKAESIETLTKIRSVPPFTIFRLPESQLVEVARYQPAVYDVPERGLFASLTGADTVVGEGGQVLASFHDMALEWYDDIEGLDRWVVADGPSDWPRIESIEQRPETPLEASEGVVSDIVVESHRVSFHTTAIGVPHLVKISYFPNWQAEGADGPWRATPSFMVVVPTSEVVVLEFTDTWAEIVGRVLTVGGLAALAAMRWGGAVRRRLSALRRGAV